MPRYGKDRGGKRIRRNRKIIRRDQHVAADGSLFWICYRCFKVLTREEVTIDHVIPRCKGGNNSEINLKVCCWDCNQDKGCRMPSLNELLDSIPTFDPEK
jgi:5-methylcytosine-specific restriction endonuclease McrA